MSPGTTTPRTIKRPLFLLGWFCIAISLLSAGCHCRPGTWNPLTNQPLCIPFPQECTLPADISKADLVAHLNRNISKLYAWKSTDAKITVRGPGLMSVKLDALIAVESPKNFRLTARASVGGQNEADFGSNPERFWYWLRRSEVKRVFTARHDHMQRAQHRLHIPFEPGWLLEALGVVLIDEEEVSLQRRAAEETTALLVSERVAPDGQRIRRRILVDTCTGYVLEHSLYDESGQLIAKASLSDHRIVDAENGIVMPQKIELNWPPAKLKLTMHLGQVEINPDDLPEQVWQVPDIPDHPPMDLGL